mmetsp:Transcript_34816/g.96080  ORF Transcript_34816/g.96080 Transcript_34816/m.96080 type:complete len:266 (+) Transcript_34816:102-899(+)
MKQLAIAIPCLLCLLCCGSVTWLAVLCVEQVVADLGSFVEGLAQAMEVVGTCVNRTFSELNGMIQDEHMQAMNSTCSKLSEPPCSSPTCNGNYACGAACNETARECNCAVVRGVLGAHLDSKTAKCCSHFRNHNLTGLVAPCEDFVASAQQSLAHAAAECDKGGRHADHSYSFHGGKVSVSTGAVIQLHEGIAQVAELYKPSTVPRPAVMALGVWTVFLVPVSLVVLRSMRARPASNQARTVAYSPLAQEHSTEADAAAPLTNEA